MKEDALVPRAANPHSSENESRRRGRGSVLSMLAGNSLERSGYMDAVRVGCANTQMKVQPAARAFHSWLIYEVNALMEEECRWKEEVFIDSPEQAQPGPPGGIPLSLNFIRGYT